MPQKRALIVDDSRSARVILGRMLEGYALQVDSSESAELALEYLRQNKPDVIFMDHLMPGMDGFQAIQAIKSDPRTAAIPVVMYTSQEGELYVSQARALGAVGVLPKTVKQADVSRVLYQLRLLPDRRDGRPPASASQSAGDIANGVEIAQPAVSSREFETALRTALTPALKEQSLELRRFFAAGMEAFARRLGDARTQAAATPAAPAEPIPLPEPPPPPETRWPLFAAIAVLALLPTIVLAVLYSRTAETTRALMQSNARLVSVVEEQQSQLATLQKASLAAAAERIGTAVAAGPGAEVEPVPYGETPLAGSRLERLRDIVDKLKAQGFHGKVKVITYVGEFCLTGNGIEGYSVAADDLPWKRCDLVGNPFEDGLVTAQRQSLAFANLLSTIRQQSADGQTIEVSHAGRRPATAYPDGERVTKITAGEWNRIAAQNNRVEFGVEAAS
jgi:CheY-like chemotaxis protein